MSLQVLPSLLSPQSHHDEETETYVLFTELKYLASSLIVLLSNNG